MKHPILMAIYLNDVQVISPTRIVKRIKWLDRSIGFMFAVSLVFLLAKIGAEALAEMIIK